MSSGGAVEHIGLQHAIKISPIQFNPMVGKDMTVVFQIVANFLGIFVFQPRFQFFQNIFPVQLIGGPIVLVHNWYVIGFV